MRGHEAEEERPLAGLDDPSLLINIKGKRTKRLRTPTSSSASGCESSSSGTTLSVSTEEEEDMAYCLILLAQGGPRRRQDEESDEAEAGEFSRSNKRFAEVVAASGGGGDIAKAGFYVYECKTCNRTFPSFQALGGHRASHKKPKLAAGLAIPNSDEDEEEPHFRKITLSHPLSSFPNFPAKLPQPASKPKTHECSICGTEFTSGQALGGHMRRHRTATATSGGQAIAASIDSPVAAHRSRGTILPLDLNLPAPDEDPKFQFVAAVAAPPGKPLLFPAPTLVGCHY